MRSPAGDRPIVECMADDQHYDVIVVGTGAGGGTLAHRLAPSGKRVLLLERGDYLPRERDNWDSAEVFVEASTEPRSSGTTSTAISSARGELLRRRQHQVLRRGAVPAATRGLRGDRHHGGLSPAWPIGYEELEPYYTEAEHLYLVHGRHGEDPTEGPASGQYPFPPVEHEPRIQQLSDDLEKQGLHPFHLPIGVGSQDERGWATRDSVCIRCDRVDGFPCVLNAKSDAQVICVDPALEHDNVRLVTNAHVLRLETDATGAP